MKQLDTYILEKLRIDKNTKINNSMKNKLMERLQVNIDDKEVIDEIWHLFDTDCENIGNIIFSKDEQELLSSSVFELIVMMCVLLLQDRIPLSRIDLLGTDEIAGNPYNYSWFEEQNADGETILEIIQKSYHTNKKVKDMFKRVYDIFDKYSDATEDNIWGIVDILYEEDPGMMPDK